MARPGAVYQLKVALRDVKPAIWRRIQVAANIKLDKLHLVLQRALVDDLDDPPKDEKRFELQAIAAEKSRFIYEYDFGDDWEHEILVEKVLPPEPGVHYPRCLAGQRACPPEDCGGAGGNENLLAIVADPRHEGYADMMSWLGGPFDAGAFDVWRTDAGLRSPRRNRAEGPTRTFATVAE